MAEHGLQELGEEEDRAEERRGHQEAGGVAGRERAPLEQRGRQHRRARAPLVDDEGDQRQHARGDASDGLGAAPAGGVAAHEPPHDPERGERDQHQPREVERAVAPARLRDPGEHERHRQQPDRDVDPEDPLPGQAVGDRAADHRPAPDGQAGQALQRAHRRAAALGREGGADERQRERHHERRADALDGTGDDQRGRVGRQRAGGRGEREQRQARGEQPSPPEAVAERGRGQQQHREGEVVGVHRPLEFFDRGSEVGADRGERGRDDERVERDHEGGDSREGQHP